MSEGFKGFIQKDGLNQSSDELNLKIRNDEVTKLIKEYKRLKKYQKSNLYEISRLSGTDNILDRLLNEYGIDPEALE
mgnify:FL=1|tara:strand:+ start:111 stop:341 length:231 start_codon:yes stop_codon:yes gene_type:complete